MFTLKKKGKMLFKSTQILLPYLMSNEWNQISDNLPSSYSIYCKQLKCIFYPFPFL